MDDTLDLGRCMGELGSDAGVAFSTEALVLLLQLGEISPYPRQRPLDGGEIGLGGVIAHPLNIDELGIGRGLCLAERLQIARSRLHREAARRGLYDRDRALELAAGGGERGR